jgi:hypothetical protein
MDCKDIKLFIFILYNIEPISHLCEIYITSNKIILNKYIDLKKKNQFI